MKQRKTQLIPPSAFPTSLFMMKGKGLNMTQQEEELLTTGNPASASYGYVRPMPRALLLAVASRIEATRQLFK